MSYDNLGIMLDCSRNGVLKVETVKRFIELMSAMGFNSLQLYTEDTYEVEGQPYFGYKRGRYSNEEIKEMDVFAKNHGVELIPCVQTLAHLNIFRWNDYREINDCADILLAEEEKTYRLIDDMFASLAKNFTSRRVNIGMDEAHMLGLGKYLDKHGYRNRFSIICRHLQRVMEISAKYGFKPMMWSDMFFNLLGGGNNFDKRVVLTDEQKALIPKNLSLIYWDYYHTEENDYKNIIDCHKQFGREIWFAGGGWSWNGFCPATYYALAASKAAVKSCIAGNITNMFLTLWGDNGRECSPFATLPTLYSFAEYVKGNFDDEKIKNSFKKIYCYDFDDFCALSLPDCLSANKVQTKNPSKYMLYNDPFLGIYDNTYLEHGESHYADCAKKLCDVAKQGGEFSYLFENAANLCKVLEVKYALGVKTRNVYLSGDKSALRKLAIDDYIKVERALQDFYESFCALWEKECKPFGFEVQDVRLGGLILRIKHCRRRIIEYLEGKTESIPELEETILPLSGNDKEQLRDNVWLKYVSAGTV